MLSNFQLHKFTNGLRALPTQITNGPRPHFIPNSTKDTQTFRHYRATSKYGHALDLVKGFHTVRDGITLCAECTQFTGYTTIHSTKHT